MWIVCIVGCRREERRGEMLMYRYDWCGSFWGSSDVSVRIGLGVYKYQLFYTGGKGCIVSKHPASFLQSSHGISFEEDFHLQRNTFLTDRIFIYSSPIQANFAQYKIMKEARVSKDATHGLKVQLHDVPIPIPMSDQVLIKVVVAGGNPKDWKFLSVFTEHEPEGFNSGDDIAGVVESVGSEVAVSGRFKAGDRVAAFHVMMSSSGAYAEHAVAPAATTFHIPDGTGFEEAATIPLCATTAALGLFSCLGLSEPWVSSSERKQMQVVAPGINAQQGAIIVYGAASATGAFAIKLLMHADIHPILCVAGNGISFVETLIDPSKGDRIIDYRDGNDAVVTGLTAGIPAGHTCKFAYDAVSGHQSTTNICQVIDPLQGRIALLWPLGEYRHIPESITQSKVSVAVVHEDPTYRDVAERWFKLFAGGLQQGWLTGHPYEICEGGLLGVENGLRNLMQGRASACKYVFRVADTPGLGRDS